MWEWCIHVYNISPINMAMAGGWFMTLFYPHYSVCSMPLRIHRGCCNNGAHLPQPMAHSHGDQRDSATKAQRHGDFMGISMCLSMCLMGCLWWLYVFCLKSWFYDDSVVIFMLIFGECNGVIPNNSGIFMIIVQSNMWCSLENLLSLDWLKGNLNQKPWIFGWNIMTYRGFRFNFSLTLIHWYCNLQLFGDCYV